MLFPHERLLSTPVMSLQTGMELARTESILVDPRDLTIVAYELSGHNLDQHPSYLRPNDVRELSNLGLIVDSSDEFVGLSDVIRIEQVASYGFSLIGLDVRTERGKRLGKVSGYTIDSGSFSVQQLIVKRPLLKSFGEPEFIIHRSQIVTVSATSVTVVSADGQEKKTLPVTEFSNPFKQSGVQPETYSTDTQWPYAS